jgi:hypothetical protein
MRIPNIYQYKDYRHFFQDFLAENRTLNPKFSQRFFSQKLKWPVSLFSDLIRRRKSMTLSRCLEFCMFAEFNGQQTVYFTFLCINASLDDESKKFIEMTVMPNIVPDPKCTHHGIVFIGQNKYQEIENRVQALEGYLKELEKDSLSHKNDQIVKYQYDIRVSSPMGDA